MTTVAKRIPNNPLLCESRFDGHPCDNVSSYVYKSAVSVRFICDACAARYDKEQEGNRLGSKAPVVEYARMELIPAREILIRRLQSTEQAREAAENALRDEKEQSAAVLLDLKTGGSALVSKLEAEKVELIEMGLRRHTETARAVRQATRAAERATSAGLALVGLGVSILASSRWIPPWLYALVATVVGLAAMFPGREGRGS